MSFKPLPRQIALIGSMRTGTTVTRQLIGSAPNSADLGEVFHAHTYKENNFWGFLSHAGIKDLVYQHPTAWADAWLNFIQIQRERFGADIVVFDAKTDYFPFILRHDGTKSWFFFDSTSVKYISVLRRNLLAQVLSRYRASCTNVWSVLDPDASQSMRVKFLRLGADKGLPEPIPLGNGITVDPETIYSEVEHLARRNSAILDFLGDRIDLQVWFEDLFDHDGQFSPEIVERLGDVCCIDPHSFDRKPSLLKQSSDSLLYGVANPDALIARFTATPFDWMLRR